MLDLTNSKVYWLKGQYNGKTWRDKVPDLKAYITRIEDFLNPIEPLYMEAAHGSL